MSGHCEKHERRCLWCEVTYATENAALRAQIGSLEGTLVEVLAARGLLATKVAELTARNGLREIGAQLSNIAFNIGQPGVDLTDRTRAKCAELAREWDAALRAERGKL